MTYKDKNWGLFRLTPQFFLILFTKTILFEKTKKYQFNVIFSVILYQELYYLFLQDKYRDCLNNTNHTHNQT